MAFLLRLTRFCGTLPQPSKPSDQGHNMRANTAYLQILPLMIIGLFAGSVASADASTSQGITSSSTTHLNVYKSPTCGCCAHWIDHAEENGYTVDSHHPEDLTGFKLAQGIGLRFQSCHTAISAEGYRFEGHVPAKYVTQYLLAPPPGSIGLAVPGMPVGSPGMEMGDRFMPYEVLLLQEDGSHTVYAELRQAKDQR